MEWSEEEINQMEAKFKEFVDKFNNRSLRWDWNERTITFSDELREEKYWIKRFYGECPEPWALFDFNGTLLKNIYIYIYYVTEKDILQYNDYHIGYNLSDMLSPMEIYYPKHHLTVKIPDDEQYYKNYKPEEIKEMHQKFEEFMCKFNDRSLSWDFKCNLWNQNREEEDVEFGPFPERENDYWFSRFKREYKKVKEGKDDKDCELLAAIHVYIYYRVGDPILGCPDFPDHQGCLEHLETKTIFC